MTRLRHAAALLMILILLAGSSANAAQEIPNEQPAPGNVGAAPEPIEVRHLYDYAELLDDAQEASIVSDAERLERFGVPSLILVQASDMTLESATTYTRDLLSNWNVESEPGADDGLVMLVVVDLTEDGSVFTVMAWGENALPHFGIDHEVASRIHERWFDAYVQEGYVFEGILYSLRRLVYHSIYDSGPDYGLEGFRSTAHLFVSWLAPIIALAGIALALARWTGQIDLLHPRRREVDLAMTWGTPLLTCIVAALAVWAESGTGVVSAVILGTVSVAEWVRRDPVSRQPHLHERVAP